MERTGVFAANPGWDLPHYSEEPLRRGGAAEIFGAVNHRRDCGVSASDLLHSGIKADQQNQFPNDNPYRAADDPHFPANFLPVCKHRPADALELVLLRPRLNNDVSNPSALYP